MRKNQMCEMDTRGCPNKAEEGYFVRNDYAYDAQDPKGWHSCRSCYEKDAQDNWAAYGERIWSA